MPPSEYKGGPESLDGPLKFNVPLTKDGKFDDPEAEVVEVYEAVLDEI